MASRETASCRLTAMDFPPRDTHRGASPPRAPRARPISTETSSHHLWAKVPMRPFVIACVGAWVLVAGGVYALLNDWPLAQGIYYACNVGFSIGFGA